MQGEVYLIGAGPGDPELLTIKAYNILARVDIVLYDALVPQSIIQTIPTHVKKIPVGKKKGEDSYEQQQRINELLLKYVSQGKTVARLKGGDPFLFGRGGEEIEFLKRNNIKYSVIPGITSALGVPTFIGLPLTHRNYSSGVMILPGHLKKGKELDWSYIAKFDGTVVILMGARNLEMITTSLIAHGKDPHTPVCIIRNGSMKTQKIFKGTLETIYSIGKDAQIKAPIVIVIGAVVNLL